MNIFVLDVDPRMCARAHYDKHVVKMIVEYAQLLSTAHVECGSTISHQLYKPTHRNHPCALWARGSKGNYEWLWKLFMNLCLEYEFRYKREHATSKLVLPLVTVPPGLTGGITEFVQCVPDHCRRNGPVDAYRALYLSDKLHIAKYTRRSPPTWWVRPPVCA